MIVLRPDCPFVIPDDVTDYRQAQTGAPVARRKLWQKEFVSVAQSDPVAGVRNYDANDLVLFRVSRLDVDPSSDAALTISSSVRVRAVGGERLDRVVDQVHQNAFHL